jgi:hypothetical protein
MPKQNETKYGKKSSFSREKSFAYSEIDIQRNEKKIIEYKNERSAERKHNINVANGLDDVKDERKSNPDVTICSSQEDAPFYYTKMNLIVCNLPVFYNLDTLVREFATYGKIQYITYMSMCEDGTNSAKLVIDGWYHYEDVDVSFIIDVQNAILNDGKYKWTSNDVGNGKMYIVRDPDQKEDELGDQIVVEDCE